MKLIRHLTQEVWDGKGKPPIGAETTDEIDKRASNEAQMPAWFELAESDRGKWDALRRQLKRRWQQQLHRSG